MPSPSPVVDATTPLRGLTTLLPELSLPPTPRATAATAAAAAAATPTTVFAAASSRSTGAGSLLAYSNPLGPVSEQEEARRGAGAGVAGSGAEENGNHAGDLPPDEAAEESDAFGEDGMGAQEMRALWDPTVFGGGDGG